HRLPEHRRRCTTSRYRRDRPMTAEVTARAIGRARKRKEDARRITGRPRYTDNMTLPGTVHRAMVRSPIAHAKVVSVDTSAAQASPGVVAVYTGADFAEVQGSLPNAWPVTPDQKAPPNPAIVTEKVSFAGDIVAVVAARSAAAARDAQELVDV